MKNNSFNMNNKVGVDDDICISAQRMTKQITNK